MYIPKSDASFAWCVLDTWCYIVEIDNKIEREYITPLLAIDVEILTIRQDASFAEKR